MKERWKSAAVSSRRLIALSILVGCQCLCLVHLPALAEGLPPQPYVNERGEVVQPQGLLNPAGKSPTEFPKEKPLPPPRTHYTPGLENELKIYIHEPEFLTRRWEVGLQYFRNQVAEGQHAYWNGEVRARSEYAIDYWLYRHMRESPNRVLSPEQADVFFIPSCFVLTPSEGFGLKVWAWLQGNTWFQRYPQRHVLPIPGWLAWKATDSWHTEFSRLGGVVVDIEHMSYIAKGQPIVVAPYVAHNFLPRSNATGSIPPIDAPSRRLTFYGRWTNRYASPRTALAQLPWATVGGAVYSGTFEVDELSSYRSAVEAYTQEILSARFCLVPRGDTPTSRRLYDAMHAGCIPVLVSDAWDHSLPFRHTIPWDDFTFRVHESLNFSMEPFHDILNTPMPILREMQAKVLQYLPYITYGEPTGQGDTSMSLLRHSFLREVAQFIGIRRHEGD